MATKTLSTLSSATPTSATQIVIADGGGSLATIVSIISAGMTAWIASLPTSPASVSVGGWWNNGGVPTQVLS